MLECSKEGHGGAGNPWVFQKRGVRTATWRKSVAEIVIKIAGDTDEKIFSFQIKE